MTSSASIPAVSRFRSFVDSAAMARNPVQVLARYNETLGDTFRFYVGGLKEAIVTIDPAVIQHVLKTNAENYQKSEIQVKRMGHFLGKGLLTTHGEAWRTQRRLIQKGFDRKQLDALSSIMQDSLAESLRDFDRQVQDGPVDIYPQLMKMTFAMVARSLFGASLKEEDIDLVSHTICTVQEFIVRQTLQPYLNPWFVASGELRRHEEMRTGADAVLMAYIKSRRKEPPRHDLLQTLMDARYSDGEGMPDELILSESMQLLVAGHETSSNALSWLFYLLSSRPDCLERVRHEFDSVLGEAPLCHADVPKLEFATQVIQEALRLYPRPCRRHPYTPRSNSHCVCVRCAPCSALLAESGELRYGSFHQGKREAAHALHLSSLRGRTSRLYRRKLRDAADPHDFEQFA
jgi:cytochrome P450